MTAESASVLHIGTRMNRSAASATQFSRASVANVAMGALHSPSQYTEGVERRVEGSIIDSIVARVAQLIACASDGTALTRAVAMRYAAPTRSTLMTVAHTGFAGSVDTTTSSSSAVGSASCVARIATVRASRAPAIITSVTATHPLTAAMARPSGRRTR